MTTALLLVGKSALSNATKADGATAATANTPGVMHENQDDRNSFPSLMKQIKLDDKRQINDDLLASLLAANPQPANPQLENTPATDASLPPAGMFLPLILSQTTPSNPIKLSSMPDQTKSEVVDTKATGPGVDIAAMMKLGKSNRDGDKTLVSSQDPTNDTEGDGAKKLAVGPDAEIPSRHSQTIDLKSAALEPHNAHIVTQTILKDLDKAISYQRSAPLVAAHPIADMAAANINTNNFLPQAGDKMTSSLMPAPISTPLQQSQWGDDLGNRIMWMVRQEVQSASIKLNPPHLGPLEVKVSLTNDQVNVSFTSHNAPVREALDASMPRLREMLGDNGLQLGNANVTHHSFSDQNQTHQHAYSQQHNDDASLDINSNDNSGEQSFDPLYTLGNGAIDIYA